MLRCDSTASWPAEPQRTLGPRGTPRSTSRSPPTTSLQSLRKTGVWLRSSHLNFCHAQLHHLGHRVPRPHRRQPPLLQRHQPRRQQQHPLLTAPTERRSGLYHPQPPTSTHGTLQYCFAKRREVNWRLSVTFAAATTETLCELLPPTHPLPPRALTHPLSHHAPRTTPTHCLPTHARVAQPCHLNYRLST
jgi:hypothetical protein